jgi:hypothetical protein
LKLQFSISRHEENSMNSASNRAPFLTLEFGDALWEPLGAAGSGSGLHVTLATGEGTLAALRVASELAQNLSARNGLMVTGVVPFCFRLDKPPGSIDFLERRAPALVSESDTDESDSDEPDIEESDIDAEEGNIEFLTKSLAFRHEILMRFLCLPYGHAPKLNVMWGKPTYDGEIMGRSLGVFRRVELPR